jgi:uncharacterized protein YndB with AHSA1/START domain
VRTRRSRVIAAPIAEVWRVAADPHHLPRWWPATDRVEGVSPEGWTSVLSTPKGRVVRADYAVAAAEPPTFARWRQELEGTPFERLFAQMSYELRLTERDGATAAELALEQEPRGWARLGRLQLRAGARRQLDTALGGLATVLEPPPQ